MQRYFITKDIIDEKLNIAKISDKENVHHIKNVMRMNVGDKIILCTNDNFDYLCVIDNISNSIDLKILEKKENNNELNANITIAQGLVRREKKEEVLRRLVELGCYEYIPVEMERSIVKINKLNENSQRVNTIIKECSEQSERGKLMLASSACTFKEFIKLSNNYDVKLVCFEDSGRSNDTSLVDYENNLENKNVLVLVGPEGGISPNELKELDKNGFVRIGLGKRILRTETAPLFIMSILSYFVEMCGNNEKN